MDWNTPFHNNWSLTWPFYFYTHKPIPLNCIIHFSIFLSNKNNSYYSRLWYCYKHNPILKNDQNCLGHSIYVDTLLTSNKILFWLLHTATTRSAALIVSKSISRFSDGSLPLTTALKKCDVMCKQAAIRGINCRSFDPLAPLMNLCVAAFAWLTPTSSSDISTIFYNTLASFLLCQHFHSYFVLCIVL